MSDAQLRRAERADPSSVEALTYYLRTNPSEWLWRVELAAFCGHEAARALVGDEFLCPPGEIVAYNASLGPWIRGLTRWGYQMLVRAAESSGCPAPEIHKPLNEKSDIDCLNCIEGNIAIEGGNRVDSIREAEIAILEDIRNDLITWCLDPETKTPTDL